MLIRTVGDLVDYLEQYDPNDRLRVAYQPSWPLAARVVSVASEEEMYADEAPKDRPDALPVVWIALEQDSSDPYAPSEAWAG